MNINEKDLPPSHRGQLQRWSNLCFYQPYAPYFYCFFLPYSGTPNCVLFNLYLFRLWKKKTNKCKSNTRHRSFWGSFELQINLPIFSLFRAQKTKRFPFSDRRVETLACPQKAQSGQKVVTTFGKKTSLRGGKRTDGSIKKPISHFFAFLVVCNPSFSDFSRSRTKILFSSPGIVIVRESVADDSSVPNQ